MKTPSIATIMLIVLILLITMLAVCYDQLRFDDEASITYSYFCYLP
jgi:hypothetical protein